MAERRTLIAPCWLILLLLTACAALGEDRVGLEKRLQADYVGKYWIIKGFYGGQELVFDAEGRLSHGEAPESWTLAGVEITQLRLNESAVEIHGKRVGYIYDRETSAFSRRYRGVYTTRGPEFENVKITLQFPASARESTIRQTIEGALIPENQDLSPEVPGYWLGFIDFTNGASGARLLAEPTAGLNLYPPATGGPVSKTGKGGVIPPHPLSTPDPQYSAAAGKGGIQGISALAMAIDKSGNVTEVRIRRPVGFGLDDQAVETVRRWTFQPAERNGEPVAVMMNVEVSFRLH